MSDPNTALLAGPRQQRIREIVTSRGDARVTDLASLFNVTDETIRRDLKQLEAAGLLRRVHGGAVLMRPPLNVSLDQRMEECEAEKEAVARAAITLLGNARTLFIDEGSITLRFARQLVDRQGLHILTNMPAVAEAASAGAHEIELTGGTFDRRDQFLRGEPPLAAVRNRLFDLTVMGTSGFDPELGLLANEAYTAELRRLLVARSRRVIVLTVNRAFGRRASWCIAPFSSIHAIVTDQKPPAVFCDSLAAAGVQLEISGEPLLRNTAA